MSMTLFFSAWDKVLKELDTLDVLQYSTGERVYKDEVLDVINKYLEEVENG